MKNPKYIVLLALFFISLISAGILVLYDFKPLPQICNVGEGCYVVKNSSYNTLFFNIPNEYLSLGFFLVIFLLTIYQFVNPTKEKDFAINMGVVLMSIFALYSIYLQAFIIKAYCKYCMTMDISVLLALILILIFRK